MLVDFPLFGGLFSMYRIGSRMRNWPVCRIAVLWSVEIDSTKRYESKHFSLPLGWYSTTRISFWIHKTFVYMLVCVAIGETRWEENEKKNWLWLKCIRWLWRLRLYGIYIELVACTFHIENANDFFPSRLDSWDMKKNSSSNNNGDNVDEPDFVRIHALKMEFSMGA